MTTLDEAVALARDDSGLTVVSTLRADNTISDVVAVQGAVGIDWQYCKRSGVPELFGVFNVLNRMLA